MKGLVKVIVGSCFAFSFLVANDEVDSTYFKLLEGCNWGQLNCNTQLCKGNNDAAGDSYTYYKLIKPLSLSGEIVFANIEPSECDDNETMSSIFYPKRSGFSFLQTARLSVADKDIKQIENLLPKWFLDGLLGEVRFQVSFEIENRKERVIFDGDGARNIVPHSDLVALKYEHHTCNGGSYDKINVSNLTIKKISEKPSNRDAYENVLMLGLRGYEISVTDEFVNLRETPNGKILERVYTKDKENVLIIGIYNTRKSWQYLIDKKFSFNNANDKWIKVLYFSPRIKDVHKAIIGYIHTSQIELMGFDRARKRLQRLGK